MLMNMIRLVGALMVPVVLALASTGCETAGGVKDRVADRAAAVVRDYCKLTPALRAEKRADFQARLDEIAGPGHSFVIGCPADG